MYSFIDIETTGGARNPNKIIEVAIVNYDGNKIEETFTSLINPERSIPGFITNLTGIKENDVKDAPKFFQVAKKIVEMTEGRIFVAHNVHFDYNFIKMEFQELGFNFQRKKLCTLRLARKSFQYLKSFGLGPLCKSLGIKLSNHHRALDDTLACLEIFKKVQFHNNDETLKNDLQGKSEVPLPSHLSPSELEKLPETCGIYFMKEKGGSILYIGKSLNIKKRVKNHLKYLSYRDKEISFKNQIAKIDFLECGSELASLILESELIKLHRPYFNRMLKSTKFPFSIVEMIDPTGHIFFEVKKEKTENCESQLTGFSTKRKAERGIHKIYLHAFGLDATKISSFQSQINLLKINLGPKEYNARLKTGFQKLSYPKSNFLVKLKGRYPGEEGVIRVENEKLTSLKFYDANGLTEEYPLSENFDSRNILLGFITKKHIPTHSL